MSAKFEASIVRDTALLSCKGSAGRAGAASRHSVGCKMLLAHHVNSVPFAAACEISLALFHACE